MSNKFHEANRRRWDAGSETWKRRADTRDIWRECHLNPSLALHRMNSGGSTMLLGNATRCSAVAIIRSSSHY